MKGTANEENKESMNGDGAGKPAAGFRFSFVRGLKPGELLILIVLLVVLVWLFISMGKDAYGKTGEDPSGELSGTVSAQSGVELLEQRLGEKLSLIKGAGKVSVFLTLESTGETVTATNRNYQSEETVETAASGESKSVLVTSDEITTDDNPMIIEEMEPRIRGVLVVAEGGGDIAVADRLLRAVAKCLGVEYSKIEVLEMED